MKKIKDKLHRLLFPLKEAEIVSITELKVHLKDLEKNLRDSKNTPSPSLSDLMRETLGLVRLDFTNVDKGITPHFLSSASKDKRTQYVNELHQIFQYEVWELMCKNHIDTQGNFSFRTADGELQMLAGRMSVNGIELIRQEVKRGHEEYLERSKPPEEFDKFETTEGVPIKNDNE